MEPTCCGKKIGRIGTYFGISFLQTEASLKKARGSERERATFGDDTISVASYCLQKISSVNIEQQECCVNIWDFSGFVWTFLCIN